VVPRRPARDPSGCDQRSRRETLAANTSRPRAAGTALAADVARPRSSEYFREFVNVFDFYLWIEIG
jgi:hypothetical protein